MAAQSSSGQTTLSDKAFRALVDLDLKPNRKITPEQDAILRQNMERWYQVLVIIAQDTESYLAYKKAELLQAKQESIRKGPQAKGDYFALEAETNLQLIASKRFLSFARDRQRQVKELLTQQHEEDHHQGTYEYDHSKILQLLRQARSVMGEIIYEPFGLPPEKVEFARQWIKNFDTVREPKEG
jgi:hypothetical protein